MTITLDGTLGVTTPAETITGTLAVTGITTVAAGSAALPSIISTTGTADTGEFFPAADTIAWSTAGTERMRIDSSGNVGIGNTPDALNKLEVTGRIRTTGAVAAVIINARTGDGAYAFYDPDGNGLQLDVAGTSSLSGTAITVKKSNGYVGIATTAPSAVLEIAHNGGSTYGTALQIKTTSGTDGPRAAFEYYNGGTPKRWNVGIRNSSTTFGIFEDGYVGGFGTERLTVLAGGDVGIGTTTQVDSAKLSLYGGSLGGLGFATSQNGTTVNMAIDSLSGFTTRKSGADFWYFGRSGSANCVSSGGSWVNSSDERLKENIVTLPDALNKVCSLRGVSFNRISSGQPEIGLIAQEVQEVYPDVVEVGDYLGLNYGALVGALVEAIKDLKTITETLTARITALETE